MPPIGLKDKFGVVVVRLAGTVDLIAGRDLVRMQHPLAVETQRGRTPGHQPERLDVTNLEIGPVDRGHPVRPRRDQDGHQDVVVGVTHVVARGLLPDHERAHVEAGR